MSSQPLAVGTPAGAVAGPYKPVRAADERVGINGALAAALTSGVGSMPALYLTLALCGTWMVLATWGPLHPIDPYPFGFLLFLNNVVQLVLCAVILVGQRVLGMAADRRAVQTYENAEAIFARVADLQAHLDRQDRALGRGASLLESSTHPWAERHRVQPVPQAIDHVVGTNGRIAAWLTQRLGSMGAFYIAAGTQVVWIVAAETGLQRFDPYPFAFMTFLSTFAQLVFMIVIMVGQRVLSLAADRRSEQTFLDAEAVLYECRRMELRLAAQDRVIDRLADYTSAQVTEHLAQALRQAGARRGPQGRPPSRSWNELPEQERESSRRRARQLGEDLAVIGCLMVPAAEPGTDAAEPGTDAAEPGTDAAEPGTDAAEPGTDAAEPGTDAAEADTAVPVAFAAREAELLARLEYGHHPDEDGDGAPVPWDALPAEEREQSVEAVRYLPAVLADVGFHVLRTATDPEGGAGESDFTAEDWALLQRALMASGVLVALAEGGVDPEEVDALVGLLREAALTHPRRLIRELAGTTTFDTGVRADTRYADYREPALRTISAATSALAGTAPAELDGFRAFLGEIAATVADANNEGGFFGFGARPRTPREAAAMRAVERAARPV